MSRTLWQVVKYSKDRISLSKVDLDNYVTTDNLLQKKLGKVRAEGLPPNGGSTTKYKKGDILIANIRPYLKKIWYADNEGGSSADVLTLRVDDDYDSKFVYYALFRDDFFNHMVKGSKGTKMPRGDKDQILDFTIPDFDPIYQSKVAKVLSDVDSKISINNRINHELEAMAKLIYDYWFMQFDFPDENGKPYKSSGGKMVYNEQLKRDIPEGWKVKELGDLLDCNYRNIKKEDDFEFINYLDTSNLTNNKLDELQYLSVDDKWPSRAQRVIAEGDILYSTVRPNQNHHGIIKSVAENMIGSTGFAQLRSSHKELKPDIIYTFLKSDWVTTRLHQIAELSVTSYPSISPDDILFLKMALPDFDSGIIASIGDTLDGFYRKIDINQRANQKLSELRDWLLPMLMNGQVTVGEAREYVQEGEVRMAAEEGGGYG